MRYRTLLEVRLQHLYYADHICHDLSIEPTADTQARLRKHRCAFKALPDGLRIWIAVTDQGAPYIGLPQELVLDFHLKLNNPNFALLTDLTAHYRAINPTYTNRGASPQLALETRSVTVIDTLTVREKSASETFLLSAQPAPDLEIKDFKIEQLGRITKPIGYEPAARVIRVNTLKAAQGKSFTAAYPTAGSTHAASFAAVEIHHDTAAPEPVVYQIVFTARAARWVYTIVTDRDEGTFKIRDQDSPDLQFNPYSQSSPWAGQLAQSFPAFRQIEFISDQPLSCQQTARKGLQLYLDNQLVMKALPNPSPHSLGMVTVGGSRSRPEEAFHQVIKYVIR
jgi:hypothetical protein